MILWFHFSLWFLYQLLSLRWLLICNFVWFQIFFVWTFLLLSFLPSTVFLSFWWCSSFFSLLFHILSFFYFCVILFAFLPVFVIPSLFLSSWNLIPSLFFAFLCFCLPFYFPSVSEESIAIESVGRLCLIILTNSVMTSFQNCT